MLDFLTFTGVDSETPMKDLLFIAQSGFAPKRPSESKFGGLNQKGTGFTMGIICFTQFTMDYNMGKCGKCLL